MNNYSDFFFDVLADLGYFEFGPIPEQFTLIFKGLLRKPKQEDIIK